MDRSGLVSSAMGVTLGMRGSADPNPCLPQQRIGYHAGFPISKLPISKLPMSKRGAFGALRDWWGGTRRGSLSTTGFEPINAPG